MTSRRYARGPEGMTRAQRTVWNRHLWAYRFMCWRFAWYRVRGKVNFALQVVFWLIFFVGVAAIADHTLDLV